MQQNNFIQKQKQMTVIHCLSFLIIFTIGGSCQTVFQCNGVISENQCAMCEPDNPVECFSNEVCCQISQDGPSCCVRKSMLPTTSPSATSPSTDSPITVIREQCFGAISPNNCDLCDPDNSTCFTPEVCCQISEEGPFCCVKDPVLTTQPAGITDSTTADNLCLGAVSPNRCYPCELEFPGDCFTSEKCCAISEEGPYCCVQK